MFILEEPYVSKLLLETLEKYEFEVLENGFIKKLCKSIQGGRYKLNLVPESKAGAVFEDGMIYSNSENSINWVLKNFPNSSLSRLIGLCKDKCAFRKALRPLYPDFLFREVNIDELSKVDFNDIKKPFIIKPAVGFLSLGVHKVRSTAEFEEVKKQIRAEIDEISQLFPKSVLNISKFIIEQMLVGEEFAVDVYYNGTGEPVILNILKHPFLDGDDVSDRAYITSKAIIEENLKRFKDVLVKIGKTLDIKNFPMHIELISKPGADISDKNGVVPVEINPMRFAGWCTTDLAYFAYGINVYEYFAKGKKPDWKEILPHKGEEIYYFAIAERPKDLAPSDKTPDEAAKDPKNSTLRFDYEAMYQNFSNILEKREIDYAEKPVCAILFGSTENMDEINKILKLDMKSFVKGAKQVYEAHP